MAEKPDRYERYKDLEDLLFKGFLYKTVEIGGISFVFKSVNDLEVEQVKLMSGINISKSKYSFKYNISYLYHSIYMIEGQNFLKDRENQYFDFFSIVKKFPFVFIKNIFKVLDGFSEKMEQCVNLIEPYSYEKISRYNWKFFHNYKAQ